VAVDPREFARAWLARKGLDLDLAIEAGVTYKPGPKLWFTYELPDGTLSHRLFDLTRDNQEHQFNYRIWQHGSKAKGSLWFPVSAVASETSTILLCEGETDALAAVQSGCPWRVACSPGAAMTSKSLQGFAARFRVDRYVCAFDNDDAGNDGAQRVLSHVGDVPVCRLAPPPGQDLKEWLKGDQPRVPEADWDKIELSLEDIVPRAVPRPAPSRIVLPSFSRPIAGTGKPSLHYVWSQIARPLPKAPVRTDAQGRKIYEAFCPIHDDGRNPGAWLGEERWGCWVCGIDSADVYELVAWTRNVVQVGQKLRGQDFVRAKELANTICGVL